MAAFAVSAIERDGNSALAARLIDFALEFAAVHQIISHISVRLSRCGRIGRLGEARRRFSHVCLARIRFAFELHSTLSSSTFSRISLPRRILMATLTIRNL